MTFWRARIAYTSCAAVSGEDASACAVACSTGGLPPRPPTAALSVIRPEEIGALTPAPILADDVQRDEQGKFTKVGKVYWYPDYQVRDEIEELRQHLQILFLGVQ